MLLLVLLMLSLLLLSLTPMTVLFESFESFATALCFFATISLSAIWGDQRVVNLTGPFELHLQRIQSVSRWRVGKLGCGWLFSAKAQVVRPTPFVPAVWSASGRGLLVAPSCFELFEGSKSVVRLFDLGPGPRRARTRGKALGFSATLL